MKALIFNSGIGKRMGELTAHCPKSMVHLYNDETIFERQIRLLQEAGIKDVIITTGPYPEMLKEICSKPCFENMRFTFVHNERFDQTNYIYSLYKARGFVDDDFITLHGDLVFDRGVIPAILKDKRANLILINKFKSLPPKDFKGRLANNKLAEVGVNIFDKDCFALQPIYKLDKLTFKAWINKVEEYVESGNVNVYAENALNEIAIGLNIFPFSYARYFVDEIDNADDLVRVNKEIEQWDYKKQSIRSCSDFLLPLKNRLKTINSRKPFVVVDSFLANEISKKIPQAVIYSHFNSNPKYVEMLEGLDLFKKNRCDSVVSIGGGSCIDVAKVIKMSINSDINSDTPTFRQPYNHNSLKHICVPSTSGTGSESTKHAVLYLNGVKQSISHPTLVPDYVILCPKLIRSVPEYQKKATMMDALCQCIESLWSRKATKVSKGYALKGLNLFKDHYRGYLNCNLEDIKAIQLAANYSGKAINISETTAAHAMSYKITSLYSIPHGHAVAICMNAIMNNCKVRTTFSGIDVKELFNEVVNFFKLEIFVDYPDDDLPQLVESINPERLSNFIIKLTPEFVARLYLFIGGARRS